MEWDALNICALAKGVSKSIVTIIGGPHAGAHGRTILEKSRDCDFVLVGEGEVSFPELLGYLKSGQSEFEALDGIHYRKGDKIYCNAKEKYIEGLDTIPFPARHLLPMHKYLVESAAHSSYKNKPFATMITSRGCPAKCTFCAIANHWGIHQRKRSANNVLDEIGFLINTYGIKEIHFEDDNFTADRERALEIFDGIIERGYNITWTVPSGMAVYSLDNELLSKMKESGCYSISLAIENGDQDILSRIMCKPVSLLKVPPLVKEIRKLGMDVRGFFILGYPGESKETIEKTINFARQLELDWAHFFVFSPLPGTPIYKTCIEKGYMKEIDFDPLRSFYQPAIKTPEFDQEFLVDARERAIIDVNFTNNANLRKYDIDKAIASFQNVVEMYPHFDFANFYLGEAYWKKGETEKAIYYFKKTVELNPEHQEAANYLRNYSAGG